MREVYRGTWAVPQSHIEIAVASGTLSVWESGTEHYEEKALARQEPSGHATPGTLSFLPLLPPGPVSFYWSYSPHPFGATCLHHLSFPCGKHTCLVCVWQPCSQV